MGRHDHLHIFTSEIGQMMQNFTVSHQGEFSLHQYNPYPIKPKLRFTVQQVVKKRTVWTSLKPASYWNIFQCGIYLEKTRKTDS